MDYYKTVENYYDKDAQAGFEKRAEVNSTLQKIREDFRRIASQYPFSHALEVGCGPGLDAAWFASQFTDRRITAFDISGEMVRLATARLGQMGLTNAVAVQGKETDIGRDKYELIYVFFGALNTVDDLNKAAAQVFEGLKPGGHAVLTFVNKWYLREMFVQLLKLKFRTAFARIGKTWGGYSPSKFLPSRCYSPRQIRQAFHNFNEVEKKGYSIVYPAWYNHEKVMKMGEEKAQKLWALDQFLNKTPFWKFGEYTLFVFQKEGNNDTGVAG